MEIENLIREIDELKAQLDTLRPIPEDRMNRVMQKLRLDWDYHSNSIEGNTLSKTETRALLLHGITAHGKPMRDHLEMRGHHKALRKLEEIIHSDLKITERLIKEFHEIILVEPFQGESEINPGEYKTRPNYLYSPDGERLDFDPPERVAERMNELINWLNNQLEPPKRKKSKYDLHPIITACIFHLRFIQIHPFGDGNGRMARILMNLILMQQGYKPAIIRLEKKEEYYRALNQSSEESPDLLVGFVADELLTSMEIAIRGAKGEIIEDELDLEKEVELLKRMQHQPIKRSKEVEKEVLDQIYLPLLSELDEKLELIGELFDESSWTYFEEHEKVNENMNATNQFDSLRNIQRYFRSIPDKFERSHHDYKASYWLLDYKDETEFSMEVALRLHLEEFSYYVEVFIGQPHESSKMMKLFAKALQVFAKDEEPITKFKSFNCLEKKYGVGIGEDEIKSLAREIGKSTVEELKKNISERKND